MQKIDRNLHKQIDKIEDTERHKGKDRELRPLIPLDVSYLFQRFQRGNASCASCNMYRISTHLNKISSFQKVSSCNLFGNLCYLAKNLEIVRTRTREVGIYKTKILRKKKENTALTKKKINSKEKRKHRNQDLHHAINQEKKNQF